MVARFVGAVCAVGVLAGCSVSPTQPDSRPATIEPSGTQPTHSEPSVVVMPNLIGMSWPEAFRTCSELGFTTFKPTDIEGVDPLHAGTIISQDPAAGTRVRQDVVVSIAFQK
ncbi:PASTA domain-containing protein [Mycobacteroides abscessus]|uniref:PASTA domain-containing protein n=1 Tax=Mycobacteroides abscessus TaxID=36809 RepID=UPI000C269DE5